MRRFFTPSMGVACLALGVALSGTAYAVTRLPANSVGTKQVINGSLQRVDFKRGMLQGPPGIRLDSVSIRAKSAEISPTAGVDTRIIMTCPEKTMVLYGGFRANVPVWVLEDNGTGQDWYVYVRSTGATNGGLPGSLYVYTACVKNF